MYFFVVRIFDFLFCIRGIGAGFGWRAVGSVYCPQVARADAGGQGAHYIAGESF
jgi:hypothetical protein